MLDFNDKNVLKALKRLYSTPDFRTLISHLEGQLKEYDAKNRALDGPQLYRGQGVALTLNDIVSAAKHAELSWTE